MNDPELVALTKRMIQVLRYSVDDDANAVILANAIRSGFAERVAEEREACARLADEFCDLPHGHVFANGIMATRDAAQQIAAAIRARANKPQEATTNTD
jgi:hypothetical protein